MLDDMKKPKKPRPAKARSSAPRISVKSTIRIPLSELKTYPGNARRGNVNAIAESLDAHGQYRALVVQRSTHRVLAGNHTFLSMQARGAKEALVHLVDVDDDEARRIVVVDNRTSDLAVDDADALSALLEKIRKDKTGSGLVGTGFNDADADDLLKRLQADTARAETDGDGGPNARPDGPSLADRFGVPPFSVLDARKGEWQDRKRRWLALGIQPKVGSGGEATQPSTTGGGGMNQRLAPNPDMPGGKVGKAAPRTAHHSFLTRKDMEETAATKRRSFGSAGAGRPDARLTWAGSGKPFADLDDASARIAAASSEAATGTSIFDPVLIELMLRWYGLPGGRVLDPFAGGTSGGCVASTLGFKFVGVEVRADQVEINRAIARERGWSGADYVCADSSTIDADGIGGPVDFVCTDPPYFSLERYSDQAADGSTKKTYAEFFAWYAPILRRAADCLKDDRFMVVKIGEARDAKGNYPNLVGDTARALMEHGLFFYNSAILVTRAGSLPMRAGQVFTASRKLGTSHQHVLVFVKGDAKRAHAACGPVTIPEDVLALLELEADASVDPADDA